MIFKALFWSSFRRRSSPNILILYLVFISVLVSKYRNPILDSRYLELSIKSLLPHFPWVQVQAPWHGVLEWGRSGVSTPRIAQTQENWNRTHIIYDIRCNGILTFRLWNPKLSPAYFKYRQRKLTRVAPQKDRIEGKIVDNRRTELVLISRIFACNTFIRYPLQSQVNQKESIKNHNSVK